MSGDKIFLSGIKPTGRPHVGNFFGAMRQFVDLQDNNQGFVMIADYHALTTLHNPADLREQTLDMAIDYLAIGLDPKKTVLFKQSDVGYHTELAWIFNCVTTMPYLMRAHAFKDAEAKNKDICVGTFDYPLLMAADILLYQPDFVPVGQDQSQHVEIARDTAEKFNNIFGSVFKLPLAQILKEVGSVPGVDGRKMSKSYNNTISLFAEDEEIERRVMSIITDSRSSGESLNSAHDTVFALHRLFSKDELPIIEKRYEQGSIGYKESKQILAENIKKFIAPLREKRKDISMDKKYITDVLNQGKEKARSRAKETMSQVREKIGVTLH